MNKTFISPNCKKDTCNYYNNCCKISTEVVKHHEEKEIDIFIYGMGAGKEESLQGRCFVGRSGSYMRSIIKYLWDTYESFSIALSNNVRFHPMDKNGKDREPTLEEIDNCKDFLIDDFEYLKPKVIIPVGRNATRTFLPYSELDSMGKMRGIQNINIRNKNYTIVPTYHPSFLCRQYGSFKPQENNIYDLYFIEDIKTAIKLTKELYDR